MIKSEQIKLIILFTNSDFFLKKKNWTQQSNQSAHFTCICLVDFLLVVHMRSPTFFQTVPLWFFCNKGCKWWYKRILFVNVSVVLLNGEKLDPVNKKLYCVLFKMLSFLPLSHTACCCMLLLLPPDPFSPFRLTLDKTLLKYFFFIRIINVWWC